MNKNTLEDEKIISHQWDFPFTELILNELDNSRQEGKSVWLSGNESKLVSRKKMLEMASVSRKKDWILVYEMVTETGRISQQRSKISDSLFDSPQIIFYDLYNFKDGKKFREKH